MKNVSVEELERQSIELRKKVITMIQIRTSRRLPLRCRLCDSPVFQGDECGPQEP